MNINILNVFRFKTIRPLVQFCFHLALIFCTFTFFLYKFYLKFFYLEPRLILHFPTTNSNHRHCPENGNSQFFRIQKIIQYSVKIVGCKC